MRNSRCRQFGRFALISWLGVMLAGPSFAQEGSDASAPGVNPKDNLTKTELLYRYDSLDLGDSTQSVTFKYDQAFNKQWGANLEVPFVAFKGFGLDETGLGDIQARVRYTTQIGQASVILGGEMVLPTASDDALGRGKVQLNPAVGAVFPLSHTSFVFFGYKHMFSIGGDGSRPDINESQPRILAAYTSPEGWWVLGDLKYTRSWESNVEQLDADIEFGRMIGPATGVWARVGTSFLDSDRDVGLLLGVRFIK